MYIPGETRENEKNRKLFIEHGGLLTMLLIISSDNDKLKSIPIEFLENLDLADYGY